jgi:hypothetical protein
MSGACVWIRKRKDRFSGSETARKRRNVEILVQLGLIWSMMGFSAAHSVKNQTGTGFDYVD